jgi:hypothetical protein
LASSGGLAGAGGTGDGTGITVLCSTTTAGCLTAEFSRTAASMVEEADSIVALVSTEEDFTARPRSVDSPAIIQGLLAA